MAYHVSILYSVSMVSCSEDYISTDGLSCEYPVLKWVWCLVVKIISVLMAYHVSILYSSEYGVL